MHLQASKHLRQLTNRLTEHLRPLAGALHVHFGGEGFSDDDLLAAIQELDHREVVPLHPERQTILHSSGSIYTKICQGWAVMSAANALLILQQSTKFPPKEKPGISTAAAAAADEGK